LLESNSSIVLRKRAILSIGIARFYFTDSLSSAE